MRFCTRYTCFSSLHQGSSRQAPLIPCWDDVLLSAMLLTLYLPYSRVYVCLSDGFPVGLCFLDHRSPCRIGWNLLASSTFCKSLHGVPPFRVIVCRCFRLALYAELLLV